MSGIKDAKRRQRRRRRKKKIQRLTVIFGSLFLIFLLVFAVRGISHKINEKEKKAEKKAVMEIIKMGRDCGGTKEFVMRRLCDKYGFDEKEARELVDLHWEN